MQVVVWLGKEEEHRVWSQNMPGGELAVFAEAVSVTLVSMGKGNLYARVQLVYKCVCACVCACVCMCVYVCVHACVHVCVHV